MQTIRIIISDGRAQRVEITETPKKKLKNRDIHNMLRSMPKALLPILCLLSQS